MHFTPQRARHGFDETRLPDDSYRWIRESGSLLQPMRHEALPEEPPRGDSTRERRATSWPGQHTERYGVDVRH